MAGFGLDANMLARTDDELKAKIGWLAYIKALSLALRDTDLLHLRYNLDGAGNRSAKAHTVIVGNCGMLQGNIQLLPDATVDDGRLDIALMRPETLFTWLQTLGKIFWENGVLRKTRLGRSMRTKDVNALAYLSGEKFTITLSRPEKLELDGDEFGETDRDPHLDREEGAHDPHARGLRARARGRTMTNTQPVAPRPSADLRPSAEPDPRRQIALIVGLSATVAFVILRVVVALGGHEPLPADVWWHGLMVATLTDAGLLIAWIPSIVGGTIGGFVIGILVVIVFLLLKRKWDAATFALAVIVVVAIGAPMSYIIGRLRPGDSLAEDSRDLIPLGAYRSGHHHGDHPGPAAAALVRLGGRCGVGRLDDVGARLPVRALAQRHRRRTAGGNRRRLPGVVRRRGLPRPASGARTARDRRRKHESGAEIKPLPGISASGYGSIMTTTPKEAAAAAQRSPVFETIARIGYIVLGIVHIVIGWVAISIVMGGGGDDADQGGAMERIREAPLGVLLLWIIALGLLALAIWQIAEAFLEREPDTKKKWGLRIKYVGTAVIYIAIAWTALIYALGGESDSSNSTESFTAGLLGSPGGIFLLVLVGLLILGNRRRRFIVRGVTRAFEKRLNLPADVTRPGIVTFGMVGYIAKGIAIAVTGVLFIVAAFTHDPEAAGGLDDALHALAALPFGPVILWIVGVGLIIYGIFCFARARYAKM